MPDLYRRGVDCDLKEIRIPRTDLIRGRRTGIIITLLPISSETVETTRGREKEESEIKRKRERKRGNEREKDRKKERETERETKRGERFALGTRYIDRLYAMLAQRRGVLGR